MVSEPDEPRREHMQQEPPEESGGGKGRDFLTVTVRSVSVGEPFDVLDIGQQIVERTPRGPRVKYLIFST